MSAIDNREKVMDGLLNILYQRFGLDKETFLSRDTSKHLMSTEHAFDHRQLLYIFFDVESVFNIRIPEKDINSGRFGYFDAIVDIISEQLADKEKRSSQQAV